MTAFAFFFGLICGGTVVSILLARSYRDELAERDEWERTARRVLREIARTPHFPAWIRKSARELLADEAGA